MADYYADSSVLVKRHVHEIGANWFRSLSDPSSGNIIMTARISLVEVYSALNRRLREAHLDVADYTQIAADFAAVCATEYELSELTPAVVEQARQLLERHTLRAYDAVQLSSALLVDEALIAEGLASLTFLTADDRLLNVAQAEGLSVDNPNLHA